MCALTPQLEALVKWNWDVICRCRNDIRVARDNFPHMCDLTQRYCYPAFSSFVESAEMFNEKTLHLTLTVNYDGLQTGGVKMKIWPVYVGLNDTPTRAADKIDNMATAAILFVPSGLPVLRQTNRLLSLLDTELNILEHTGFTTVIEGETWTIKFKVVNISVDLQAEVLFFNKIGWQNINGCPDCCDGGYRLANATRWVVTLRPGQALTPRPPMTIADAERGINGFKQIPLDTGRSTLLNRVLPQECNPDALHLVFHGWIKDILIDCYADGDRRAYLVMSDQIMDNLTEMELLTRFPQSERCPGSNVAVKKMTASETETFLFSIHMVACAEVGCTTQGAAYLLLQNILLLMYLDVDPTPQMMLDIEDFTSDLRELWDYVCGEQRNTFKAHRYFHHLTDRLFNYGSVFMNTSTRWEKMNKWLAANFNVSDTRGPFRLFMERFVLRTLIRPRIIDLDKEQPLVKELMRDIGYVRSTRVYSSKLASDKLSPAVHDLIRRHFTCSYELFGKLKRGQYTYSSADFYCGETVGDSSFALIREGPVYCFVRITCFVKPQIGHSVILCRKIVPLNTMEKLLDKLDRSREVHHHTLARLLRSKQSYLFRHFSKVVEPTSGSLSVVKSSCLLSSAVLMPYDDSYYISSFHRIRCHV